MRYKAIDGQEITEEMINNWCSSYDKGEFPEGEYTVGKVVMGRPPLSVECRRFTEMTLSTTEKRGIMATVNDLIRDEKRDLEKRLEARHKLEIEQIEQKHSNEVAQIKKDCNKKVEELEKQLAELKTQKK